MNTSTTGVSSLPVDPARSSVRPSLFVLFVLELRSFDSVTAACRRNLPIATFYCGMIDLLEIGELVESYEEWRSGSKTFSFFQFPFLISLGRKAEILVHESRNAMEEAARQSRRSFYGNELSYLLLTVRRSHIVEDSLRFVSHLFPLFLRVAEKSF